MNDKIETMARLLYEEEPIERLSGEPVAWDAIHETAREQFRKIADKRAKSLEANGYYIVKKPYTKDEIEVIQTALERGEATVNSDGYLVPIAAGNKP